MSGTGHHLLSSGCVFHVLKNNELKKNKVVILIHLEKTSSLDSFNSIHTLDAKNYVLYTMPLFLMMY